MTYQNILITPLLFFALSIFGQKSISPSSFEQDVIEYTPEQRVSDKRYSYGMMILSETKKATNTDPANFNLADYFNVLSAFLTLDESEENINAAFEKFVQADGSCEYIVAFEDKFLENEKYGPVRAKYIKELKKCRATSTGGGPQKGSFKEPSGVDELQGVMLAIKEKDQRYRSLGEGRSKKQKELDRQNQADIDSLYDQYGKYIGYTMVGKELEDVMWLVIQHSDVDMMKRYLPVVHSAVQAKELSQTPLKMLIDRFYAATEGYQFFGSQGSEIPLAEGTQRSQTLNKYDLL